MPISTILYSVFLMPIQLIFELVFSAAYGLSGEKVGIAIVVLSLTINLLVLPLYRRADAMQEEERLIEARLHDGVAHIKKTFRGNERTMMLQTYYRQNNYSPLYVLRSAVSLLLEIPFFIAAYRFLSGLSLLQGVSFGPIADLGVPDGLIPIGGISINVLPILMTLINVISTVIFTKGYPLKSKIQLYAMAAFFLVFLYDSPSGLVFYWTLNNLFSLIKTIFYKIHNPKKVLRILVFCGGILAFIFGIIDYIINAFGYRLIFFCVLSVGMILPFVIHVIRSKKQSVRKVRQDDAKPNKKLFLGAALFLTALTGLLIPTTVIASSAQEFIIVGNYLHPVWYAVNSLLIAAGFFVLWLGIFYWLFSPRAKVIFERVMLVACGVAIVNYLFFSNNLGILNADLIYDNEIYYSFWQIVLNILVLIPVGWLIVFIVKKKAKIIGGVVAIAGVALFAMSVINTVQIFNTVNELDTASVSAKDEQPELSLSKDGQNVVVIMLDRAMGEYIPYIMEEHPELAEKLTGFTYYSNVISYGGHTNFGVPALFGGYEYTPVELNKRDTESLQSKHDEALKVMPVLFDQEGYKVTVCDPPYAGYKEIPDLSIYDEYPGIRTYYTQGTMSGAEVTDQIITNRYRNFFCHSIVKSVPVCLQRAMYNIGTYHNMNANFTSFSKSYDVLKKLSDITTVSEGSTGSFIMMENDTTHNSVIFADDRYMDATNDYYHSQTASTMTLGGVTLSLEDRAQISSYQTNIAALMRLADWFDELKKQGVYDNTRIILVSDHGFALNQIEELYFDETTARADNVNQRFGDAEFYFPLLLVKDFDSSGALRTDDTFMTNADVPTLATAGVIDKAINPFTGKVIESTEKTAHPQYIIASDDLSVSKNNGNTYLPSRWYSVSDSIWDKSNWELITKDGVITQYDR